EPQRDHSNLLAVRDRRGSGRVRQWRGEGSQLHDFRCGGAKRMTTSTATGRWCGVPRGFSLIEIMVGVVIGLIAVLVIYQVYTVAEGFKRNTTLANSALFTGNAAPGATFPVQSPGGFHVGDLVVGISAPTTPSSPCASSKVTAVSAPDGKGIVTITQTPLLPAGGIDFFGSSVLLNMGPCNRAQKVR